jgi:hypothetical protein
MQVLAIFSLLLLFLLSLLLSLLPRLPLLLLPLLPTTCPLAFSNVPSNHPHERRFLSSPSLSHFL